jgi:integrase
VTTPTAYIQPLLQVGFYTGMRREEIIGLRWINVDVAGKFIHLLAGETKNDEPRDITMLDGLPALFEAIKKKEWGRPGKTT